jgi:hypothetical protein
MALRSNEACAPDEPEQLMPVMPPSDDTWKLQDADPSPRDELLGTWRWIAAANRAL